MSNILCSTPLKSTSSIASADTNIPEPSTSAGANSHSNAVSELSASSRISKSKKTKTSPKRKILSDSSTDEHEITIKNLRSKKIKKIKK